MDVPDLFGENVTLPCSIVFFANEMRDSAPEVYRTECKVSELDEGLARLVYNQRGASATILNLYEPSEINRLSSKAAHWDIRILTTQDCYA